MNVHEGRVREQKGNENQRKTKRDRANSKIHVTKRGIIEAEEEDPKKERPSRVGKGRKKQFRAFSMSLRL